MRQQPLLLSAAVCLLCCSCANDMEQVAFFDRKELPVQSVDNAHVVRSSDGSLQVLLDAPQIDVYKHPEAKTVYPTGVAIDFYGSQRQLNATIKARYAVSYDSKDVMEARDSVVIVDHRSGDTVYMRTLVWDAAEHRVYSHDTVRSVNGQRITYGDGFESDEDFENPQIIRQRGTIEWNDDQETKQ